MPTLPSHSLAQNTSGFSDVPHCLNSERGRWARNCAMYELSGIMSILFCIISRSIFLGEVGRTDAVYIYYGYGGFRLLARFEHFDLKLFSFLCACG